MTGHGTKFERKMEGAIAALLTHPTIEDAARVAGVGEKTLRRWKKEPQFKAEYLQARKEVLLQSLARLQQATGAASVTILRLMADPKAPAAVRLRAAECVLDRSSHGIEREDIEARLAALEAAISESNKK